ncbi:MAG TPA: cobalamin-dependent protein, partial [Stenomitos sp.]
MEATAPRTAPVTSPYQATHKVRFVTAASLFDGHDASINIMRRILQDTGAEVIHLGHNRSVAEIVETAIQEDAQGIAISSYQGGHVEYFKYMIDLLRERGAGHIKVFGGGGGVIVPAEIAELEAYGVSKIFSPEDGRQLGLQGMIDQMVAACDVDLSASIPEGALDVKVGDVNTLARLITLTEAEERQEQDFRYRDVLHKLSDKGANRHVPVLGITGTGGAGKSSLVDELIRRYLRDFADKTVAILSVDPSKRKTGGALLGDRIRMNAIYDPRVYMRSLATRASNVATSKALIQAIGVAKAAGYDLVIVETAGIGQSDSEIVDLVDVSMYVMTSEFGAQSQLEKIDMLDYADLVVINKFDKRGAEDALRDVRKQYQRGHKRFNEPTETMPVYGTIASQFNDAGTNWLYVNLIETLSAKAGLDWKSHLDVTDRESRKQAIIPPERNRYLAEISDAVQGHKKRAEHVAARARDAYAYYMSLKALGDAVPAMAQLYDQAQLLDEAAEPAVRLLRQRYQEALLDLDQPSLKLLQNWPTVVAGYTAPVHSYTVRGKEIRVENFTESLSHLMIPKVSLPKFHDWGDLLFWQLMENVPGRYPFT